MCFCSFIPQALKILNLSTKISQTSESGYTLYPILLGWYFSNPRASALIHAVSTTFNDPRSTHICSAGILLARSERVQICVGSRKWPPPALTPAGRRSGPFAGQAGMMSAKIFYSLRHVMTGGAASLVRELAKCQILPVLGVKVPNTRLMGTRERH